MQSVYFKVIRNFNFFNNYSSTIFDYKFLIMNEQLPHLHRKNYNMNALSPSQ